MCIIHQKRRKLLHLIIVIMVGVGYCYFYSYNKLTDQDNTSTSFKPSVDNMTVREPITNMANPAAVYCQDLGYIYRQQEGIEGSWGECVLPDIVCDAWDFLSGKCGAEYSYCSRLGLDTVVVEDGMNPYSPEYALCESENGVIVQAVTDLFDMETKITKKGCEVEEYSLDGVQVFSADNDKPSSVVDLSSDELPSSFDWRSYLGENWLPPIRDQGSCGSCWAFSAIGVAEAAMKIFHSNPDFDIDLSEQYLVSDCDLESGNCCGGFKSLALGFITDNGVPDEGCMTYVDGEGCSCEVDCSVDCAYHDGEACSDRVCSDRCIDWEDRIEYLNRWGYVWSNQTTIKEKLIEIGPLAASMGFSDTYGGNFDGNGIYRCTQDIGANHAVVIVGYDDSEGAWIVRNSMGTGWGDNGYFKVGYGECFIEYYVYYGLVTDINEVCTASGDLSCGDLINGNNGAVGSNDLINYYGCSQWAETGPEYAYRFDATRSGQVTVSISNLSDDLDVFILDGGCSAGSCIAYGDESAVFDISAGKTYYIVVDGYDGAVSDFTIEMTCDLEPIATATDVYPPPIETMTTTATDPYPMVGTDTPTPSKSNTKTQTPSSTCTTTLTPIPTQRIGWGIYMPFVVNR